MLEPLPRTHTSPDLISSMKLTEKQLDEAVTQYLASHGITATNILYDITDDFVSANVEIKVPKVNTKAFRGLD